MNWFRNFKTILGLITWQTSIILLIVGVLIVTGILSWSFGISDELIEQVDKSYEVKFYDQSEEVYLSDYKPGTIISAKNLIFKNVLSTRVLEVNSIAEQSYIELYPGYYQLQAEYEDALVGVANLLVVDGRESQFKINYGDIECVNCVEECKTLSCLINDATLNVKLENDNILFPISAPVASGNAVEIRKVWITNADNNPKTSFANNEIPKFFAYIENVGSTETKNLNLVWKVLDSKQKIIYSKNQSVGVMDVGTGIYAVHTPEIPIPDNNDYKFVLEVSPLGIRQEVNFLVGTKVQENFPDLAFLNLNVLSTDGTRIIKSISPGEKFNLFVEFFLNHNESIDSIDLRYVITDSNNYKVADSVETISDIAPNRQHSITIKDFLSSGNVSQYRIEVYFDPLNKLVESSKFNNRIELILPVSETGQYEVNQVKPRIYELTENNFIIY